MGEFLGLASQNILFFELIDWYWVKFDFCHLKGIEQLPLIGGPF